jgi:hypothetical protein
MPRKKLRLSLNPRLLPHRSDTPPQQDEVAEGEEGAVFFLVEGVAPEVVALEGVEGQDDLRWLK